MKRYYTATAALLSVALLLTGCSGGNLLDQITNSVVGHDYENAKSSSIGDERQLIPVEMVTDSFGTYQRTTIDPTKVKITSIEGVISEEDAESAKNFAINFAASEALDSIALDNYQRLDEWFATVGNQYVHPDYVASIRQGEAVNNDANMFGLILHNTPYDGKSAVPQLMRDGKPRIANKSFGDLVEIKQYDSSSPVEVRLSGSATYFVGDKGLFEDRVALSVSHLDEYPEDAGVTEEVIRSSVLEGSPELADGKPHAKTVTFEVTYSLLKDSNGGWKIAGYSGVFKPGGDDIMKNATDAENAMRDNIKK